MATGSGAATIGALNVIIGANTASLETGLKRAQSQLSQFGKFFKGLAAGLATGFSFGAIISGIKKTVDEADKLDELAQSVGMTTEELSALQFVAQKNGVELDALGTSIVKLSKNMAAAARDPAGQMALAFKTLGISIREGVNGPLKSSMDVLKQAAGSFSTYNDSVTKTDAAVAIFGKTGAAVIPILNLGTAALVAQIERARELGVVISTQTAKAASDFKDELADLTAVKNALWLKITADLLPALTSLTTAMVKASNDSESLTSMADNLTNALRGVLTVALGVAAAIDLIAEALAGLIAASILAAGGQGKAAVDVLEKSIENMGQKFDAWQARIKQTWTNVTRVVVSKKGEIAKGDAPLIKSAADVEAAAKKAAKSLEEMKQAGQATFDETRLPAEKFTERLKELDAQLKANVISAETYARAVSKAKNEMIKADPAAQIFENALSSALDRAIDGTGTLIEQLKALARDLAKAFASAAFKVLLFGQSGGLQGSGLIGGLFGQNTLGLQHGGSFRVGGSGPADSQLVAFRATPGERVDVRTPGQQRDMGPNPVNVSAPVRIVNAIDAVDFLSKALGEAGGEKVILNYVRANPAAFRAALS